MQIYSLIKNDHRKIKDILSELSDTTEKAQRKRPELLAQLKQVLIPHSRAEEIVLYDELKLLRRGEAVYQAYEGYEEHRICDHVMQELEHVDQSDPRWRAKFEVLKEMITHHIEDEEENVFEQAKTFFSLEEAEQMAQKFESLKKEFTMHLPNQDEIAAQYQTSEKWTRGQLAIDSMDSADRHL